MRHLSTEELLLQSDGQLSFARVAHLQGCPLCKAALADLEQLLFEVEQELRATVPQEPVEERLASWLALERTLYPPPTNGGFPIRWPAIYATAAALTIAVFAGYISSRQTVAPPSQPIIAANVPRAETAAAAPPADFAEQPLIASVNAPGLRTAPGSVSLGAGPVASPVAAIQRGETTVVEANAGSSAAESISVPAAIASTQLQRFELNESREPSLARTSALADVAAPQQESLGFRPVLTTELASVTAPPMAIAPPQQDLEESRANAPEAAAALVEGHWILAQANVWSEDVVPVWTGNSILFRGTVENTAVQRQVAAAITKAAGSGKAYSIDLQLRTRDGQAQPLTPVVTLAAGRRSAGGVVRNSLLAHFGDAARRSFVSPQPAVLDSEIDRFVTEVFRNQSDLRSHAYALKTLVRSLTREQVAQLDPSSSKKLRELVRTHVAAVGEGEQQIYDRLSETLPRRFWSYRAADRELAEDADWRNESTDLLKEVLQLDATLTALLSTPQSFVDISDSHLSSGELLYRIRSRVHRIRAAAELTR